MRRMRRRLLFFFRGCVECPASVGGNVFCIKRLTSPSLCFGEASLEFGFTVLLSGSVRVCAPLSHVPHGKNPRTALCSPQKSR